MKLVLEFTSKKEIQEVLSLLEDLEFKGEGETILKSSSQVTDEPKAGKGRPKGAKNKKKGSEADEVDTASDEATEDSPKGDKKDTKKSKKKKGSKKASNKEVTAADVRKALTAHAREHGRDKTYEILSTYDASNVKDVDAINYADLLADLAEDD